MTMARERYREIKHCQRGDPRQDREIPGIFRPQQPVVGAVGIAEDLGVVDGRASLPAVFRQPARHAGYVQRLQQGQVLRETRRGSVTPLCGQ